MRDAVGEGLSAASQGGARLLVPVEVLGLVSPEGLGILEAVTQDLVLDVDVRVGHWGSRRVRRRGR